MIIKKYIVQNNHWLRKIKIFTFDIFLNNQYKYTTQKAEFVGIIIVDKTYI